MVNRGFDYQDIQHYLNTDDTDILPTNLMLNVDNGVKMLVNHISQNDKVLVVADSDCDGYTSTAVLLNYLYCLFPGFVQNNITYRIHEGKEHGVVLNEIPDDVQLVIYPDAASNNYEEHQYLKQQCGIDILVIDHHEAEKISEYACVINNQLCEHTTKSLSGVGMVYKFCKHIDYLMDCNYADNFLDLVALGIIADMVSMKDFETKRLVEKGLNNIQNPYFKGMVEKNSFKLGTTPTPIGVAFYVAPYVNATIRVGTQEEKLILLESMLDYQGYELIPSTKRGCKGQTETKVEQACRNCTNIKNRQTNAVDVSLNVIKRIIEEHNLLENKVLAIKLEPEYQVDKRIVGLVANKLMAEYQKPTLLLNRTEHTDEITQVKEIWWEGSGRGYDKSKLTSFKDFLQESNLVEYAEGHAQAFGAGIKDENFSDFIIYSNNALANYDFSPQYKVDFIYDQFNIKSKDILEIAGYDMLWGQGVAEPKIVIENINLTKNMVQLMSPNQRPTLKITLPQGISLIKFGSSNEEYEALYSELGCVTINVVGRCEKNVWNGTISPQINIEQYEIVNRTNYYF